MRSPALNRAFGRHRVVVTLACVLACCAGLVAVRSSAQPSLNPPQYAHGDPANSPGEMVQRVVDSVLPATFHLLAEFPDGSTKTGTGFVVEGDGKALTYAPLVRGASRVRARASDGTWLDCQISFADSSTGVAGLFLQGKPGVTIVSLALGFTEETALGETVATLGLPSGVLPVISVGRLAGSGQMMPERSLRTAFALTDALIAPATVGGPVVAADGRVIGICTDGQGVFVPITTAQRLLGVWRDRGQMGYSMTGLTLAPIRDFARGTRAEGDFGCVLAKVEAHTPADDAGLLTGDRLLEIDGIPINALEDEAMPPLRLMLDLFPADKPIRLQVRRGEEIITTEIVPMREEMQ